MHSKMLVSVTIVPTFGKVLVFLPVGFACTLFVNMAVVKATFVQSARQELSRALTAATAVWSSS